MSNSTNSDSVSSSNSSSSSSGSNNNDSASPKVLFYNAKDEFGELSNYAMLREPLVYTGKTFASSEHLYQWHKFNYENASADSLEYADLIRQQNTPNKARILALMKRGGGYKWRTALNTPIDEYKAKAVALRADWHDVKLDIMLDVLRLKFSTDRHSRDVLLSTGDAELVEHTRRDSFWGDGGSGSGGHLGRLLQQVRSELLLLLLPTTRSGSSISGSNNIRSSNGYNNQNVSTISSSKKRKNSTDSSFQAHKEKKHRTDK